MSTKKTTRTNQCPDVKPELEASGIYLEKDYDWMVLGEISPRPEGSCNVLLVAPGGFPGSDDNAEILTCLLAEELDCFAVVNNRKHNPLATPPFPHTTDLNDSDEALKCRDFRKPLVDRTEHIMEWYTKPPLVLVISGIGDLNAEASLGSEGVFALGAGYEGSYDPKTATASLDLMNSLEKALTKSIGPAKDGVAGYGAVDGLVVGLTNELKEEKIEAVQIAIRCAGYRDSEANVRKLVTGLKDILTSDGLKKWFTGERRLQASRKILEKQDALDLPATQETIPEEALKDQKIAPMRKSVLKNECPDVRPRLRAVGVVLEKEYPWMVLRRISVKRDGQCNVLLVAPHGFPGDDDNVEILSCMLAEKDRLDCFAVVNNRKYNRKTNSDDYEFWQDLNDKDLAPTCKDFWDPLMDCTKLIIRDYGKPPVILFIHGIGNDNAKENLGTKGVFALGAGYEGPYNPDTATASEGIVIKLRDALTKRLGLAKDGVKDYGATQSVPVLFKELFPNQKIEAIQLEIRCRGYRDSVENIQKLVDGVKEILTDIGEEGFQDYFTRERRTLQGITIEDDFKSLIPPLSEEEYRQLEENIVRAGRCHDPLSVWPHEGKLILLDGHHRSEICHKHGLPDPGVVEVKLRSREDAILWIAEHQLGRRSLSPFQRIELAYRMEPAIRVLAKARQREAYKLRGKGTEAKDEAELHSDEMLGKIARVSARTYRKARDVIKHGSDDLIQKCREGEIKVDAAFKEIEKPRKQRPLKKVVKTPDPAVQPAPQSLHKPLLLTASQAVPQTDEPVSAPDLPPPCDVIVVNVPWELPSVTLEKLAGLPIRDFAQDNCMVWLRATNSRIMEAYSLLNGWGFEPKTLFTWIKQEAEPAEWLNDRSEHYVVGVKGNPPVDEDRKFSTALETSPAKDNPTKAMQFYRQIERFCSGDRRLEVFPKAPRDGWIPWNPWTVDRALDGMMREMVTPERGDESSKKELAKSTKKERKRQGTHTKKKETRKESS